MTPDFLDMVVVLAVLVVMGVMVWLDLTSSATVPHPKEPMKTYPPLPELVCTCGDCWELTGDRWQLIECGCDTTYKIFTEREDSL